MIPYPIQQRNHNYISAEILPWLRLHYPADSAYQGRILIGQHHKDGTGIYDISCRQISELQDYIQLMHISGNLDYYITANAVSGVRRTTDAVFSLHNIVIDIDCHTADGGNTSEAVAALLWRASRDLWSDGNVPSPCSVVITGRGVQLWWAIEPISAKVKYWYERVRHWLMDRLSEMIDDNPSDLGIMTIDHAASNKLAGWYRLPLTYNTRAKRWGKLQILRDQRYALQDLIDCVPEDYRPQTLTAAPRRSGATGATGATLAEHDADVIRGCTTAMARRVLSLMELRSLRQAAIGSEMRDLYNLIVYCSLRGEVGHEQALERTLAFNLGFGCPMDGHELQRILSTAQRKGGYHLTNAWVIQALDITADEQDLIGMHPARSNSRWEGGKPNSSRDAIRRAIRDDRNARILALYKDGLSRAEIAQQLEISRNTVAKIVAAAMAQEQQPEAVEPVPMAAGAEASADPIAVGTHLRNYGAFKYVSYGVPGAGAPGVLRAGRRQMDPGDSS